MAIAALQRLEDNLAHVRARIERAAERSGRGAETVCLVAVTKNASPATAAMLPPLGVHDLGENRLQVLLKKIETVGEDSSIAGAAGGGEGNPALRWHMIGTVQRKKVPSLLRSCSWFHSIDRADLWERVVEVLRRRREEEHPAGEEDPLPVPNMLIQVNISRETSKSGFSPDGARTLLASLDPQEAAIPAGLMTMAPYSDEPEDSRPVFRALAALSRELRASGLPLGEELSMGMSGDYEVAIEEGATMIRIGSRLFEGVE